MKWLGNLLCRNRVSNLEREVAEWMERSHRLEESVAELLFERDKLWQQVATWRHAANQRLDGIHELEAVVEQLNMQIESLTKKDLSSQDIISYLTHELSVAQLAVKHLDEERREAIADKPKKVTTRKAPAKKKR